MEKVPPAMFRRIADDLAECRQHLEELEEEKIKTTIRPNNARVWCGNKKAETIM